MDSRQKNRDRAKAWVDANPEKNRARAAQWSKKNPERRRATAALYRQKNRDHVRAKNRQWRIANRDRLQAVRSAWAAKNGEKIRKARAAWTKRNPEYARLANHRRIARRANAAGSHTQLEVAELLRRQRHLCANVACLANLRKVAKSLDHKNPLSKGGRNDLTNLQWLCAPCNYSKGAMPFDRWIEREAGTTARSGGGKPNRGVFSGRAIRI